MKIKENLLEVRENIENAAIKAGRKPEDVRLVAVSKTVSAEEVREAYLCGQREFAENRVQKLMEKWEGLADINDQIDWHLIGQLQTNKIKYCADKVSMIHSVDRLDLAKELDKFAGKRGIVVNGLLEVNVSGEESKTGMEKEEIGRFLEGFAELKNVKLVGLMTMAPFEAEEATLHRIFSEARELAEKIKSERILNAPMGELSMGMSGDYQIAVSEGSTICRVGTAIWKN